MSEVRGMNSGTPDMAFTNNVYRENYPILKTDLPLHQQVAAALNQAGLGPYSFREAELQVLSLGGKRLPVAKKSPFIMVEYEGPKDRTGFYRVFDKANRLRREMRHARREDGEISEAIKKAIEEGIVRELEAHPEESVGQT